MTSGLGTPRAGRAVSPPPLRDGLAAAALGIAVRILVVVWASARFPPVEDGHFYDVVAGRIARGLGYTWLWPDGAVTYAAHYPVGYPALIAAGYALFGAHPVVAMVENALLGALAVLAVHRIASTEGSRAASFVAALSVALHPGLVLYTPALMTEGVAGSLLVVAAWIAVAAPAARSPWRPAVALGVALGFATLVRPQSLLLAPLYGLLVARRGGGLRRAALSFLVLSVALAVCAPWTLRNCARMRSCVLVSANAGWNLFIGAAPRATGSWVALDEFGVPEACRTVFGEAEKDACFGRAGRDAIVHDPAHYLALVPSKLAVTFDYAGAAGFYLHASNPRAFDDGDKLALGVVETLWQRLVVLVALAAAATARGPRRAGRRAVAVVSAVFLLTRAGWVAHLGIAVVGGLLGRRLATRPALFIASTTVLATALTHAVFFGAGRYSLVCFPALSALAGTVLTLRNAPSDTE